MSCGGTTFVWRITPYGLTNMPATCSRAMQYVCRGLQDHDLGLSSARERKPLTLIAIVWKLDQSTVG
eukprot:5943302-Pleurochrysis_carterae.AAC.1